MCQQRDHYLPAADSADWGTISHYGIFDAATGGNLLIYGEVSPTVNAVNGSQPIVWTAGSLVIEAL